MKLRWTLLFVALIMVGVAALSSHRTAAETSPRRITVTSSKFTFTPNELNLKKNEPVVLVLKSSDVAHGLRFRELNVDIKVSKGGSSEVAFTPNQTGTFIGHCSVFCGSGHGSMTLTMHVVD
jgi:cytochrome c oxidase subunit II